MSESTALAKALAAQLGDDLDRILGANESGNATEFEMVGQPAMGLELRQVAGLNAGYTQPLPPGQHRFGNDSNNPAGDEQTRPFTLIVDEENRAWLPGGERGIRLDGLPISGRVAVSKGVIDAGSARFLVAQSRPPTRRRGGGTVNSGADAGPSGPLRQPRIRVADYVDVSPKPPPPPTVSRLRRRGKRTTDRPDPVTSGPLIDKLLEARESAVQHARSQFPDPGQLIQMALAGADHIGHISPGDKSFGVVPIAYGDLPWSPPFDRPDRIPGPMVVAVQQHSVLASVPLTVDLLNGHLGIVGERNACLAVARQIAVALRVLSPYDAVSFALLSDEMTTADWAWLDNMPNDIGGLPILFIDGMRQVAQHGMRQMLSEADAGGSIVIDDQLHDIPSLCKTVLEIKPTGNSALLDFRRGATTTRVSTPLGFSLQTTRDIIAKL